LKKRFLNERVFIGSLANARRKGFVKVINREGHVLYIGQKKRRGENNKGKRGRRDNSCQKNDLWDLGGQGEVNKSSRLPKNGKRQTRKNSPTEAPGRFTRCFPEPFSNRRDRRAKKESPQCGKGDVINVGRQGGGIKGTGQGGLPRATMNPTWIPKVGGHGMFQNDKRPLGG